MVEIREQGEAAIDGEVIDSDELETRLREIAQSPGGPPAVALRPQPDARCGRFVRVMNLLREIGFTRIDPGLTTPSSLAIIPPGADPFALRHGIHIDIRENGRIMCNGRRMRLDQLQSTLGKRFPSSAPPVSAIICVDPNTRFRDLRLVVDRLQRIGITDTSLDLVLPVEVTTKPTLSPEPRSEELLR